MDFRILQPAIICFLNSSGVKPRGIEKQLEVVSKANEEDCGPVLDEHLIRVK